MSRKSTAEQPVFTRQFNAYGDTEEDARTALNKRLGDAGFRPYNEAQDQFQHYLEDGPMKAGGQYKIEVRFTPKESPVNPPKDDAVRRKPSSFGPTDVFGVTRSEF